MFIRLAAVSRPPTKQDMVIPAGEVTDQRAPRRTRNWLSVQSIAIGIAVFVLLAVPIGMQVKNIIVAEATWPGTVAASIYRQGQTYSDQVSALERQEALGWQLQLTVEPSAHDPAATLVWVDLYDDRGEPIIADKPTMRFVHPLQEALDSEAIQPEVIDGSRYQVEHRLPTTGKWRLQFMAQAADGTPFRRDFEIQIPPR